MQPDYWARRPMGSVRQLANALKLPFITVGRAYNQTAQKYPATTGIVTTVIKTSAADLFAQKVIERKEDVDWRRHGMFCAFGAFYLGGFQYYLYNHLFVRWCGSLTAAVGHKGTAPIKTFIDQAIHHPFFYFPTFYLLKGAVEGRPLESSFEKYKTELWENCKALWMIWVPAQLVNFAFVPRHLRIPFVALVSFGWTVVMSVMRGALDKGVVPVASSEKSAAAEDTSISRLPVAQQGTAVLAAPLARADDSVKETLANYNQQGIKPIVAEAQI